MEVRELLSSYDFPGDDIPVVAGSALKALEGDPAYEAKIMEAENPETKAKLAKRRYDLMGRMGVRHKRKLFAFFLYRSIEARKVK